LAGLPDPLLAEAETDLMEQQEKSFHEVTDRQVRFEWVEPAKRKFVKAFIDSLRQRKSEA